MKKAVLATLAYADIFDYPLKKEEIWLFLIGKKGKKEKVNKIIEELLSLKIIEKKSDFYFLKGRKKIVSLRKKREKENEKKLKKAFKIANFLKIIPGIKMVAISGAVAMKNAKEEDDIDFLIVTKKNWMWTVRFLAVILLEILGCRRRPNDKNVKDKICLNMFITEDKLKIPKKDWNLFIAHEICQLKPLWEKDNVYWRFLEENQWIKDYLPNYFFSLREKALSLKKSKERFSFNPLEKILKFFQLWYMKKRITQEKISSGILRFHPHDLKKEILNEYQKKLKILRV
ncbi:MAG: hypothetical protein ACPLKP_03690 [Microgenomates group bacterium]